MRRGFSLFLAFGLLVGCNNQKNNGQQVVSERFIHKYGYDVSPNDWNENSYPGQVITTLRNGITITSHYEDGKLHGTTTYSFPHSTTLESAHLYDRGHIIKKTTFNLHGTPINEELLLSPNHHKYTTWNVNGTPHCIEEYEGGNLIQGEYFTTNNKIESRVDKGEGVRTVRDENGLLSMRETIEGGIVSERTEFYKCGTPAAIIPMAHGKLHGTKRTFAEGGEPLAIEEWNNGVRDGLFAYFQNGAKYIESRYVKGFKNGIERHFVDGEFLVQETEYHVDKKHGPSIIYLDGYNKVEWYYNNQHVTKEKYDELCEQERHIAELNRRSTKGNMR